MANGDPYGRMMRVMERQGAKLNGYDMTLAQIKSVKPLQIVVGGNLIERHLVCNDLIPSDKDEELDRILANEKYISEDLKQFLKDLYKEVRVEIGDQVLVQRVRNSFYICGKVTEQ